MLKYSGMSNDNIIEIPFNVSARTARLIGRENVSNAEGAIIELVKNCYDADASEAQIIFHNDDIVKLPVSNHSLPPPSPASHQGV